MPSCKLHRLVRGLTTAVADTSKMDRSPLEKASWIAGIVSAFIAVWALFPSSLEHQTASSQPLTGMSKPSKVGAPDSPVHQVTNSPLPTPQSEEFTEKPNDCAGYGAIDGMRKQASALSNYAARDTAYVDLVDEALCLDDLPLALEFARSASSFEQRDRLYSKVLDAALRFNQIDIAGTIAGKMSSFNARDNARQRIMAALRKPRVSGGD